MVWWLSKWLHNYPGNIYNEVLIQNEMKKQAVRIFQTAHDFYASR